MPIANVANATRLLLHPYPKTVYIFGTNNGNAKAVKLRTN